MTARVASITFGAMALAAVVAGCDDAREDTASRFEPEYLGIEVRPLDRDLVQLEVTMRGARTAEDVDRYVRCAVALYALERNFGFARHVRTNVSEEGGIWRGDAVYTLSSALPDGLKKIDAEVVAADCAENGIPMV